MATASVLPNNKCKDFLISKPWKGEISLLNDLKHRGSDQQVVSAHRLLEGELKLTGTDGNFLRGLSPWG